jgi:predicted secreted protein
MSFVHGSVGVFQLGTAAAPGTPTAISSFLSSVSFPFSVDTAEITALGAAAKSYLAGLEDATISLEGRFHATVDAHLNGIRRMSNISFVYGPAGSGAGAPRYSGTCMLTSYDISGGIDDVATFSAELQVIGAVTRGTF